MQIGFANYEISRIKGYIMRIEKDKLGEMNIPKETLYGIQTARALDNCSIMQIDRKSLLFLMRNSQTVLCNYLDLISDMIA